MNNILMPIHTVDYLAKNLTGNEFKMVAFIWRWTVSIDANTVNISHLEIARLTKMNKASVTKAINNLVAMDLIFFEKIDKDFRRISINLNANYPKEISNE